MDFISTWADAIARFEGFYTAGSRPQRNHNPGDLKFAGQSGAVGQDSAGFAIFPDDATGFQALYNQLNKYVRDFPGYSLLQIMAHYLGQSTATSDAQGNAFAYAGSVADALGVPTTATLSALASGTDVSPAVAPGGDTTVADASLTGDGSTPGDSGPSGTDLGIMLAVGAGIFWAMSRFLGG
jgi:hypothetical protein